MTTCLGLGCGRPVQGAFVCSSCWHRHERTLVELDDLAHALDAAFLKQQRFSVARIGRPDDDRDEAPLPFDDAAGRVRRRLSRLLLATVRTVAATYPTGVDVLDYSASLRYAPRLDARVTPTVAAMTAYLRRHRTWFVGTLIGADALNRFETLRADALRVVDRPPDLVYLGICSRPAKEGKPFEVRRHGRVVRYDACPEDLYADADATVTTCPRCKTGHSVEARRDVLLVALNDQLAPAADIARGLPALGLAVTADRIRQWKARGRLVDRGPDGRPLYRVGDVIDLVLAERARRSNTSKEEPA